MNHFVCIPEFPGSETVSGRLNVAIKHTRLVHISRLYFETLNDSRLNLCEILASYISSQNS